MIGQREVESDDSMLFCFEGLFLVDRGVRLNSHSLPAKVFHELNRAVSFVRPTLKELLDPSQSDEVEVELVQQLSSLVAKQALRLFSPAREVS